MELDLSTKPITRICLLAKKIHTPESSRSKHVHRIGTLHIIVECHKYELINKCM